MPTAVHNTLYPKTSSPLTGSVLQEAKYAKVIMSLNDILNNEPLRKGNYLMLSSPSDGPVRMALNSGTLTLIIPYHVYTRSGLTFPATKLQTGGQKHDKQSMLYRLDVDLRQPSLARSKPGFNRLVYAAKNVDGIREARTWLFADLDDVPNLATKGQKRKRDDSSLDEAAGSKVSTGATTTTSATTISHPPTTTPPTLQPAQNKTHILSPHQPTHISHAGTTTQTPETLIPPLLTHLPQLFTQPTVHEDDITTLLESLSLMLLQSPHLHTTTYGQHGTIDPYISSYTPPSPLDLPFPIPSTATQEPQTATLTISTQTGLLATTYLTDLITSLIRTSRTTEIGVGSGAWVVVNVKAHDFGHVGCGRRDGVVVVLHAGCTAAGAGDGDAVEGIGVHDEKERTEPKPRKEDGIDEQDEAEAEAEAEIEMDGDEKSKGESKEKGKTRGKGFQSVTCFEFVDSLW